MPDNYYNQIIKKIRTMRIAAGMSQKEFGAMIEMDRRSVSGHEVGQPAVSLRWFVESCRVFCLRPDDLAGSSHVSCMCGKVEETGGAAYKACECIDGCEFHRMIKGALGSPNRKNDERDQCQ